MKTRRYDAPRLAPRPVPTLALAPVLILALGLTLTGCATSPPSSFYTLTPLPRSAAEAPPRVGGLALAVGPVTFPAFLDRPQLVSRDGSNRLALDEFHRWGGSIQDDFLRVWSENLATLVDTSRVLLFPAEVRYPVDFRISAQVLSFEGEAGAQAGSEARLKIRWTILDGVREQVLVVEESSYRSRLGAPGGQEALVAAMSETLGAFSRDVADRLRRLPRPVPLPAPVE